LTENPANIPWRRIVRRAVPGILLFAILGFALSSIIWMTITSLPYVGPVVPRSWPAPLLVGFAVLQVPRLKDAILTLSIARRFRFLAGCAQILDEWSRLYLNMIIDREERKLDLELLEADHDRGRCAVHRLFEFYLIAIARHESLRLRVQRQDRRLALNVFNVRVAEVKLKMLLHYKGYSAVARDITSISADPLRLYNTWPPSPTDRRSGTPTLTPPAHRRQYEHAYVKDYILGP